MHVILIIAVEDGGGAGKAEEILLLGAPSHC